MTPADGRHPGTGAHMRHAHIARSERHERTDRPDRCALADDRREAVSRTERRLSLGRSPIMKPGRGIQRAGRRRGRGFASSRDPHDTTRRYRTAGYAHSCGGELAQVLGAERLGPSHSAACRPAGNGYPPLLGNGPAVAGRMSNRCSSRRCGARGNYVRTGRPAACQLRKRRSMFVQPQPQDSTRALARGSAYSRPNGAPAYYLGRPASLWISITSRAPRP
jgi:hypothetical protein